MDLPQNGVNTEGKKPISKLIFIIALFMLLCIVIIDVIYAKSLLNSNIDGKEKFVVLIVMTFVIFISTLRYYFDYKEENFIKSSFKKDDHYLLV